MHDNARLEQVAAWLAAARAAVAFTGAGISTDSGIPDFRSPQGVWAKYQPVLFDDFLRSEAARCDYWRQKCEAHRDFSGAEPNAGHRVLARWEAAGRLRGVITQNIDGLHQAAGSRTVLELHGTALSIACLDCDARYAPEPTCAEFLRTGVAPRCAACGGLLKHATVSFGQQLPPRVVQDAHTLCRQADLVLAIGSSLVVEPAASLPRLAAQRGARLIILNRDPTPLDSLAAAVVQAEIGPALTEIDQLLAAVTPDEANS